MIPEPANSDVLFETFAMRAYPLLRSTTVTIDCLWLAPMIVSLFLATNLPVAPHLRFTFAQGPSVLELTSSVEPVSITLALLFLASQVFSQLACLALNGIGFLVKRLVAYWQLLCNLFRAPLQLDQFRGLLFNPRLYVVRVTSAFRALFDYFTSLFVTTDTKLNITIEFSADRRLVAPKYFGNLRDCFLDFHKAGNLISLNLAEICVFTRQF
jgi:hypothetical protein